MLTHLDYGIATWALVAAAVLGPTVAVLLAMRDRHRLSARLHNLEDVLRRMRTTDPANQFDDRPEESALQLSRERLVLQNLLDRFPEVTQNFVKVETIPELGESLLAAFERVLDSERGVVFVHGEEGLRLVAETGMEASQETHPEMVVPLGRGRIGYAAEKCLILRAADFSTLDPDDRLSVETGRAFHQEFDFYIPMVHRGKALGCVAVGGMKRIVQKAHTVCMALANLGALVLTNVQRADEIRALSEEDPLTRLSNRRHFYAQLSGRVRDRNRAPFALFLFDLDHFKRINDEHGHAVGDQVLVQVADVVRNFVRREEGEFVCRFGGEEFLCVLDCEDVRALGGRLEDFRHAISRIRVDVDSAAGPVGVRISGGVSFCPAEHEDADVLIRLADDRLYAAKHSGRNRILFENTSSPVAS